MKELHIKESVIPLFTMSDNFNENLPFFIRSYDNTQMTKGKHTHEMLQINYVASGNVVHSINDTEFMVNEGDAFVIPPFIPHTIKALPEIHFNIVEVEFNPEFLWADNTSIDMAKSFIDFAYIEPFLVSEKEVKPRLNIPLSLRGKIESLLSEMMEEYTNKEPGYLLAIKALVLHLLVNLGRIYSQEVVLKYESQLSSHHLEALSRALKYIDNNYTHNITIDEIAEKAYLSTSYFCYVFKQLTHMTFIQYLNKKRIERMCSLLVSTNDPIAKISTLSGFSTISHSNRIFKQRLDMSPREYRKRYNKKNS